MGLVIGDVTHECPVEVVDHLTHGLTWAIGSHGVHKRLELPKLVVVHITAGEGGGKQVYQTLSVRGYSCHFVIDRGGFVWQFLDPCTRIAAHTGGLNAESIGIEVVNSGWPVSANPYGRPISERWVHIAGVDGKWVKTKVAPALGCLPGQLKSLKALVELLCKYHGIPYRRADRRPYIPRDERPELRGIAGHVQLNMKHGDPSLDALRCFPEAE